jgi:hypothetical protein
MVDQQRKDPLFGRLWSVKISQRSDPTKAIEITNRENDISPLRVTFDANLPLYPVPRYAEVTIYNLALETQNLFFDEALRVSVEAGYRNGNYGTIFDFPVLQALYDRENVTDYKLTLLCIDSLGLFDNNIYADTLKGMESQREIVKRMAAQARTPIPVGTITDNLSNVKLPRAETFFGEPKKYLRRIARENNAQFWINETGSLTMGALTQIGSDRAIVYTPETGLIGTPQQTQDGVSFTVLLDPRLKSTWPCVQVKLDMKMVIRQRKIQWGIPQTNLDQDFQYAVAGVRHVGDTWGDTWYTEVTGITTAGKIAAMLAAKGKNDPPPTRAD